MIRITSVSAEKRAADRSAPEIVGGLFETVHLDAILGQRGVAAQRREGAFESAYAAQNDAGQLGHRQGHGPDLISHQPVAALLDAIEDVVEVGRQGGDVFGVERRDKRPVQADVDVVDNLVAFLFELPDPPGCDGHLAVALV